MLILLALFTACGEDETPQIDNVLSYDGDNVTGPLLQTGAYEAAVRFTSAETSPFNGRQLIEVDWFMGQAPESCEIKIYGEGTNNSPGSLLYRATVTNALVTPSWNTHELSQPIDIDGTDLWISVAFTHNAVQQSIGCDAPNSGQPNGDWLFQDSDNEWKPYKERTPENINWNIRGTVSQ